VPLAIERVMEVCLRIVYFNTLPVAQPIRKGMDRSSRCLFEVLYQHLLGGTEEEHEDIVAGFPTVIWTEYIPNKCVACYQYACLHDRVGSCG
jgi:hypothetical protein